ncbi:MAG: recombination protein O N-terminal domain-containing protein [Patescibacteria group bacterium]
MYATTPAIILSSAPYREWGRSFFLLTAQKGLIHAHAIGVARMRSKLGPKLTPYHLLSLTLVSRFTDRIIGVDVIETFSNLWRDARRQGYAAWGLAAIQGSLKPGLADVRIFDLCLEYLRTLNTLSVFDKTFPSLRLAFVVKLLHFLGYRLKEGENAPLRSGVIPFLGDGSLREVAGAMSPVQKIVHERSEEMVREIMGERMVPLARYLTAL